MSPGATKFRISLQVCLRLTRRPCEAYAWESRARSPRPDAVARLRPRDPFQDRLSRLNEHRKARPSLSGVDDLLYAEGLGHKEGRAVLAHLLFEFSTPRIRVW